MAKWEQLLENESHKHIKKINKNVYCKKNKQNNGRYGPHQYSTNQKSCVLCGHINKQHKEIEDEPKFDESRHDE